MYSRLLFLSLWILSLAVSAQTPKAVVQGTVLTTSGAPAYVTVSLDEAGKVRYGAATDELGRFSFRAPAGNYTLVVSGLGYETVRQAVTLRAGETTKADLQTSDRNSSLAEVVVSAGRRIETLAETPSSVTVIGGKELEVQSGISANVANILSNAVPGLAPSTNQTGNTGQTLRGRNVLVLIDGIPQSTPLRAGGRDVRTIDPNVVERIEVIKGATSIYGNGADGGLINYITKKAPAGVSFGGYTQLGMTGNTQGDSTLGFRFTQQLYGRTGKFDYFVSGMHEKTGVFRDGDGKVISPEYGLGETRMYNAYAKLGYDISPRHRIEAMYNYYSSNQHSAFVLKSGIYGERPSIGVIGKRAGIDEGTRYNHNASLQYFGRNIIGGTSVNVSLYMQDFLTVYSNVASFYMGGQSQIPSAKKGIRVNLTSPFILSGSVRGDVTYGFDLLNDRTSQSLVDGRAWVPLINMRNLAPYAQLSATLFDGLALKAGVRAENINMHIDDFNTLATGPDGKGSIAVKGGNLGYNALVFNAGLRYAKLPQFNPFVSYSQAFSVYDLGRILRSATENTISKLQTEPIIVNNYEAGFSSQVGPLSLTAAAYLSTSKLGANFVDLGDGKYIAERAPEHVWGYEFQADWKVLRSLSLGGNFSYTEGKVDKDGDGKYNGDKDTYLNASRIAPPKTTVYLRFTGVKNLSVDLNWWRLGNRDRFQPAPSATAKYRIYEGKINSFNLWNVNVNYAFTKQVKLNLGVENLLNTSYYTYIAQYYGSNDNYTRGSGRRFLLTLGYSF
ncbi:TonB-dependent receptor [Siphonobacter aquaeclarae]|uniref:Iron complex outermembrane recepter protein n=1 Tax=Siphonobacter aquaeclarae TaxID=563176 RepID=A0A1G9U9Z5_9BACT|nr:TonB-dependent receptor [Siphonobacter aquaeclarae]SDM56365.1 iron complex outermembrane recepter protein [Siphonobacter aquaeclarae]